MPDATELDVKRLEKITADMIASITSPPFVAAMRKLKSTPVEKRLEVAARVLRPSILRQKGVKLPKDMRITSRYFETGKPPIEVNDHGAFLTGVSGFPDLIGSGPKAAGCGCACGGAATVCGGAGGGGSA